MPLKQNLTTTSTKQVPSLISDSSLFEKLPKQYRGSFSSATESVLNQFPADWPEMEYIGGDALHRVQYQFHDSGSFGDDGYEYASIDSALVAPLSRGNVTINSTDTMDPPLINPNWLTAEADVEVAIAGFKRTRQFWANMNNITIGEEYLPGPNVTTDEEILAFLRQDALELWHASATCAMGKKGDPMAVVDTHARVFGVQGLRVVDASAFPFLPPGHPQSTVYALAEKIADDIKRGQ
ncbi:hypothetical protein HO173_008977 [Letharia columbiana]|uniref:Glucose-methanol-choline oxidoreductase C-terminal domain-containing protein n=1 Tax=Letharia columbiana TaxID=112416 RepID=A0A8H6L273_9LECA|nr:uncharacterized protein HO173_008977 [Letharia columbiana]KAF6232763.1 hypothetical protein HO173_008977 [Letharia columbiana]